MMYEKIADILSDELLKEAGLGEIWNAHKAVGAAKKTLDHMQHRRGLAVANRADIDRHMQLFSNKLSGGDKIPRSNLTRISDYDDASKSRLSHANDRVQKATDGLTAAKQKRKDEVQSTFSINRLRGGMDDVVRENS